MSSARPGYLGDTALLLFVGNLTEREFPAQAASLAAGAGRLCTPSSAAWPGSSYAHFHFTSPLAAIVPQRLQANNQVLQAQLHPALSQLQACSDRPDVPMPPSPTPTTGVIAWPSCCPG